MHCFYNNETLDSLVEKLLSYNYELLAVKGFGQKRIENYGHDFLLPK